MCSPKHILKTMLTVALGLMVVWSAQAKPMTGSVTTWEGTFTLRPPHIPIKAEGAPPLLMWLYQLDQGSKGTAVGFSTSEGDMILAPHPQEKGVQPIYTGHSVFVVGTGVVEVIVTYDIQGNGGMKMAEKYVFNGRSISLTAQSTYLGKTDPQWKRTDGEPQGGGYSRPAAGSSKPKP
jgi:hypothetical protein